MPGTSPAMTKLNHFQVVKEGLKSYRLPPSSRLRHFGHAIPGGGLKAWPRFHPRQPRDDVGVRRAYARPFRRLGEERQLRRDQEVSQRHRVACEIALLTQKPRQFSEH